MPNRILKYLYYFFWYANHKENKFGRLSVKLLMIPLSLIVEHFFFLWLLWVFQVKNYKQTKKKKKVKLFLFYFTNLKNWNSVLVSWLPALICIFKRSWAIPQRKHWKRAFLPHESVSSHTAHRFWWQPSGTKCLVLQKPLRSLFFLPQVHTAHFQTSEIRR